MTSERFIIFCGRHIEPYVWPDHPVTRSEVVNLIASGEVMSDLHNIVSFEIGRPSRDVTKEIVAEVVEIWDDRGEPISFKQYEFIGLVMGEEVARAFQLDEEFA